MVIVVHRGPMVVSAHSGPWVILVHRGPMVVVAYREPMGSISKQWTKGNDLYNTIKLIIVIVLCI